mmetsp:Transcript_2976/g.5576  ORF Transcript_2976/g.5576 Transcript_2976/m.5576 type:complete len:224 (-) Transcript_2976:642-1313(-)
MVQPVQFVEPVRNRLPVPAQRHPLGIVDGGVVVLVRIVVGVRGGGLAVVPGLRPAAPPGGGHLSVAGLLRPLPATFGDRLGAGPFDPEDGGVEDRSELAEAGGRGGLGVGQGIFGDEGGGGDGGSGGRRGFGGRGGAAASDEELVGNLFVFEGGAEGRGVVVFSDGKETRGAVSGAASAFHAPGHQGGFDFFMVHIVGQFVRRSIFGKILPGIVFFLLFRGRR